jgi:hypothetical protein
MGGALDDESEGDDEAMPEAFSGRSGGAVGGTPANKRAKGGKSDSPNKRPGKTKPTTRAAKPKKRSSR